MIYREKAEIEIEISREGEREQKKGYRERERRTEKLDRRPDLAATPLREKNRLRPRRERCQKEI